MKKTLLLILALILCLSVIGCSSANYQSNVNNNESTPTTEAPTENPVDLAKEKLAAAVEECYTSKYGHLTGRSVFLVAASDGLSVTVDTKPVNDSYSSYEDEAIECIRAMNEYLSLPSAVWSKMTSTNSLDGTQTQNCGDYTVTWGYHPDNGLEVIYEVNLH